MDASSEAWRAECEARWCLQQSQEARQSYYHEVMKQRGKEATNNLIEAVNALRRNTSPSTCHSHPA